MELLAAGTTASKPDVLAGITKAINKSIFISILDGPSIIGIIFYFLQNKTFLKVKTFKICYMLS